MEIGTSEPHVNHIRKDDVDRLQKPRFYDPKSVKLNWHLRTCARCKELADTIRRAAKLAGSTQPDPNKPLPSRLEVAGTVAEIYEQSLSSQAAADFLYQIKTSDKCFHVLEKVIQESLTLQEGTDEQLVAHAEDISLADKALELIAKQPETEIKQPQPVKRRTFSIPEYGPRFAYAFAAIVVMALAAWGGVRFYNTTYQIRMAEALLEENVTFYMKNRPRLAGDYHSRGIDILMSETNSADSAVSYLTKALNHTQRAIESGSTSPKARRLQAQVFILEKEYGKADSIFSLIADESKTKAALLNDRGVLRFKQDKWHQAEQYFKAAIRADSTFKEAYYNLALAQDKLGKKDQAVATLKRYIPLETDEGWKNAARSYLNELEGGES